MEILLISIIVLLIAALAALFFNMQKRMDALRTARPDDQSFTLLQQQMEQVVQAVDRKLSEVYRANQDQFGKTTGIMSRVSDQAQKMINDMHVQSQATITAVTEKLTKLDETNRQVVGFAGQLQSLENILKNPKHRGVLGEYQLEMVLKNVLPPNAYKLQYAFGDGDIVDAAVFIKDKVIPVDSKFSL